MSDIKAGELAAIKTTGETVFVLEILDETAFVRRPNFTEGNGMQHLREPFTLAELQTLDEMKAKRLNDSLEMQSQIFGLRQAVKEAEDEPPVTFTA